MGDDLMKQIKGTLVFVDNGKEAKLDDIGFSDVLLADDRFIDKNDGTSINSTQYQGNIMQSIELMQKVMSPEAFQGFLIGNIIKYRDRLGKKDAIEKEMGKINQYHYWLQLARAGVVIKPMEHVYKEVK